MTGLLEAIVTETDTILKRSRATRMWKRFSQRIKNFAVKKMEKFQTY